MSIRKRQIPYQGDAAQPATSNTHGTTQDDTFYYFKRQLDFVSEEECNNRGHAALFITSFKNHSTPDVSFQTKNNSVLILVGRINAARC